MAKERNINLFFGKFAMPFQFNKSKKESLSPFKKQSLLPFKKESLPPF
jgi:hypothetical protein